MEPNGVSKRNGRTTPRISDVARAAGVSIATVSRTLAQPEVVSIRTRDRVMRAVSETGYTPNQAARTLRGGSGNLILVAIPRLVTPFFTELMGSFDQKLSRAGYGLLIGNLDDDEGKAKRLADLAHGGQVAGAVLLNGHILRGTSRHVGDGSIPAVAVSMPFETPIASVMFDEEHAIEQISEHLTGLGHQRFAYVSGETGNRVETARWRALQQAMVRRELPIPERIEGNFHMSSGISAAKTFLKMEPRPTAVICASDSMAVGFLLVLLSQGISVPNDVSVTGIDGIELADQILPPLTTVAQPKEAFAEHTVGALLSMIDGRKAPPSIELKGELRLGGSTGPVRTGQV